MTTESRVPDEPVHVVLVEPWPSVEDEDASWTFPDGATNGDRVITVANARMPAILKVSELWMENENWDLTPIKPLFWNGIAVAALEQRLGGPFSLEPRTLPTHAAADVLSAIAAEVEAPTLWSALPHNCLDGRDAEVLGHAGPWGCNACGRDEDASYEPCLQVHREHRSDDRPFDDAYAVCPSCHDILHQPLGPTFDQLMFSHRPACPRCSAKQTFKLMMGMPPGPPPYGTHAGGCVIVGPDIPSYVCQICSFRW